MFTEKEIQELSGKREDTVLTLLNPAVPENDQVLAVIAERLDRFAGSSLNPNKVKIADYDTAFISFTDPKNPLSPRPYYAHLFRHKETGKHQLSQVSSMYGWMVPFNICFELSSLAEK